MDKSFKNITSSDMIEKARRVRAEIATRTKEIYECWLQDCVASYLVDKIVGAMANKDRMVEIRPDGPKDDGGAETIEVDKKKYEFMLSEKDYLKFLADFLLEKGFPTVVKDYRLIVCIPDAYLEEVSEPAAKRTRSE